MPDKKAPKYNGREIVGQLIEIRKTGGAFSGELLVANPDLLNDIKIGDELDLGLRVVCVDEHYPVEDRNEPGEGGVKHKRVFDPIKVAVAGDGLLDDTFSGHAERVQRAKDAAEGQGRLPTDEELHSAHVAGEHSVGLVDGCADCEHEQELEKAGK